MSEKPVNLKIETFDFQVLILTMKQILSKKDGIDHVDFIVNNALNQLDVYFQRKFVAKTENFENSHIPKTWKDHFKHTHRTKKWMRFWIKRKPIQYFAIERITVFPDVKVPQGRGFETELSYVGIKR